MSNNPFRWGILGLGSIAGQFARGLSVLPDAELTAVGSRSGDKASAFAAEHKAHRHYGSYEELIADPDVDAIYVATPHPMHVDNTLACLAAGKPVLCEKPFTVNAAQARQAILAARSANIFLMEAMWTRFFPLMVDLRKRLAAGSIGEPRMVQADFGFRANIDPEGRLFAPKLAGGGLLDVGVYAISFASMIFGSASDVVGLADIGTTGVDEQCGMVLRHATGQISVLSAAVRTNTPQEATVFGTQGRIRIYAPFWKPTSMTIWTDGGKEETVHFPYDGNGYQFQAAEVIRCVRNGLTESTTMPLDETISIVETMDSLRAQFGIRYPME